MSHLNLRQNWLVVLTVGISLLSVGILGVQVNHISRLDAPKFGETISYWSKVYSPLLDAVVRNFMCVWPNIVLLSFVVFIIQQVQSFTENRRLGCAFLIFANLIGGSIFFLSFFQSEGHRLVHIQSLRVSDHMYHLSLDNVQGGGSDYFYSIYFTFRCDTDGNLCHVIQSITNDYDFGGNPPSARLTVDPTTDRLYLQIGTEKTLIAR